MLKKDAIQFKSPYEAMKYIQSGNRVVITGAAGEPQYLVKNMVENKYLYKNVELIQFMAMDEEPFFQDDMREHFRYNTPFVSPTTRSAVASGYADFTPCNLSQMEWLFRNKLPVDVALIQVTPPDEHGFCSLGVNVDYIKSGVDNAKVVIAQVNEQMPRSMGDCYVHISDIDCLVEYSAKIPELKAAQSGPVEMAIGKYCASLVSDGDTLQLGIGGIPDAILKELSSKKNLGIHSEMVSDGVMHLMEAGVINNKKKSIDQGVSTISFVLGTRELYRFIHNNPSINMMPASYVNNPLEIMKNENFVAINSCLEVDLMGQVVSEMIGKQQISGVGGQVDFVRGAAMAKNGKSIMAMPSTAAGGKVSRIVVSLSEGAAVTTSRNDVDYVVTEYGIAELKGKTLRERADALINIAHPDFRAKLRMRLENGIAS